MMQNFSCIKKLQDNKYVFNNYQKSIIILHMIITLIIEEQCY